MKQNDENVFTVHIWRLKRPH